MEAAFLLLPWNKAKILASEHSQQPKNEMSLSKLEAEMCNRAVQCNVMH